MIRKHLTRAAYALAAVVIAGSSVPVFAQEAEEAVTVEAAEETVLAQETENTEEISTKASKKKLRKHRHKKNTDATEDATAVAEDGTTATEKVKKEKPAKVAEDGTVIVKEKKEKPTTVAEDGTVTPKKSRKPGRKPAKKVTTDDTAATENTQ